ncbi:MAG: 30S ribosomal protein S16 [Patescibacteria group bacterium]
MSVTIRLARVGRKNLPAYKIVVAQTRDKRNGRALDVIGHYNPSMNPESFNIDKEKYEEWKKKGALVTDAVEKLIKGEYKYVPYEPKKVAKKEGGGWAGPEDKGGEEGANTSKESTETPKEQSKPEEKPTEEPKPEEKKEENKEDKKE